jgi:hypothetical protein
MHRHLIRNQENLFGKGGGRVEEKKLVPNNILVKYGIHRYTIAVQI